MTPRIAIGSSLLLAFLAAAAGAQTPAPPPPRATTAATAATATTATTAATAAESARTAREPAVAAPSPKRAVPAPARTVPAPDEKRTRSGARTLDDIHIEGEIPVPQVLFITARDQRRIIEFQHRHFLRTSQRVGGDTALPAWIVVTRAQPTQAGKENP